MGDRVSISFIKGTQESVALFNHWGGEQFAEDAKEYATILTNEREGGFEPLDRFEPDTVMVDFIRHLTKDMPRVASSLYLGKDEGDGDNSDNGHFRITLPI